MRLMSSVRLSWCGLAFIGLFTAHVAGASAASPFTIIYTFNKIDPAEPPVTMGGGLSLGPGGALYGALDGYDGLSPVNGLVFRLSPPSTPGAAWTFTDLHDFPTPYVADPRGQYFALLDGGVVSDSNGALYGEDSSSSEGGQGAIFRLTPPAKGQTSWQYDKLFIFPSGNSCGGGPGGGLILADGSIFGRTFSSVFRLTPPGPGQTHWVCSALYPNISPAGISEGGLIARSVGGRLTLFGATNNIGGAAAGNVFELVAPEPPATTWTSMIIHAFSEDVPLSLTADRSLNLYGITSGGIFFRLTPPTPPYVGWNYNELQNVQAGLSGSVTEDYRGILYTASGLVYGVTPRDYGGHKLPWNIADVPVYGAVGSLVIGQVRPGVTAIYGLANHGLATVAYEIPVE